MASEAKIGHGAKAVRARTGRGRRERSPKCRVAAKKRHSRDTSRRLYRSYAAIYIGDGLENLWPRAPNSALAIGYYS